MRFILALIVAVAAAVTLTSEANATDVFSQRQFQRQFVKQQVVYQPFVAQRQFQRQFVPRQFVRQPVFVPQRQFQRQFVRQPVFVPQRQFFGQRQFVRQPLFFGRPGISLNFGF